jgi:hypothetical protein
MKFIPTKHQWNKWTLPSKASYVGTVIGVIALLITGMLAIFFNGSDPSGQPQLSISYRNKPYLRYTSISPSGLEFSYKICVRNSGQRPACEMEYTKLIQTLVVDNFTVSKVGGKEAKDPPPQRLVSRDSYCQRFVMNNTNMTNEQLSNCIEKYKSGKLAIILEIEIKYKDEITGDEYYIMERNKIFKDRVEILP